MSEEKILRSGGIGVFPTDTLYGILGQARNPTTVERIRKLRNRNPKKPFLILISSLEDLELFRVRVRPETKKFLDRVWPGPISVAFTPSLAFRMPENASLRALLRKTGPLVAPSANPEGKPPARTIAEARAYFGDRVDFYHDAGRLDSEPSTLVSVHQSGPPLVLRRGMGYTRVQ